MLQVVMLLICRDEHVESHAWALLSLSILMKNGDGFLDSPFLFLARSSNPSSFFISLAIFI